MPRPAALTGRVLWMTATLLTLLPSVPLRADPPRIEGIRPSGSPRGMATRITVSGTHLAGNPVLLAPFSFTSTPSAEGTSADGKSWAFDLTVDPNAAAGVFVVRVQTDEGVSNPFLFSVGQVPQVAEQEDNNTFAKAQAVPAPVVVEGEAAGNDVDFFRFPGKKGQRIVVDARCARVGSGVDPVVRLMTASGRFVASDDDTPGLMTDARLVVDLPEDGDYVVELSDTKYQGQGRPIYRLVLGEVPVADEVFPLGGRRGETVGLELRGGTLPGMLPAAVALEASRGATHYRPTAITPGLSVELPGPLAVSEYPELIEPKDESAPPLRLAVPAVINGRIDSSGDEDRFTLVGLTPGQKVKVKVEALGLASGLDGVLRVLGPDGNQVAQADDSNLVLANRGQPNAVTVTSPDPALEVAVPANANSLVLALTDLSGRGGIGYGYRITVEESQPRFELELPPGEANVPRGGWINLVIGVGREGFGGPIRLKVANPPAGLLVREGMIAEGQNAGVLSLGLSADGSYSPGPLVIVGEGQGPDAPSAKARQPVTFATLQGFPTNLVTLDELASSPTSSGPLALSTPAEPIEIVHGSGTAVAVTIQRSEGAGGALEIEGQALPAGVSVPKLAVGENDSQATLTINAAPEAPVGLVSLGFTAKGKIQGADRTFAVPVVSARIVRPATLALESTAIEVKPGASAELKGKVDRKPSFQQPVTVKLDGLPAGVTAEPVSLAGDATEFTLKLAAAPGAAAAEAQATATGSFKIGDKDYPAPPQAKVAVKVVP